MKYNKFLIVIALCAVMQSPMSVCMESSVEEQQQEVKVQELPSKTYGQRMKDYMASWVPQPVKDVANKASVQQKTALGGLLLAALMGYYYRDLLMQNAPLSGSAIEAPTINTPDLVASVEESNIEPATKSTLRKVLRGAGGLFGGTAGGLGGAFLGYLVQEAASAEHDLYARKIGFMARRAIPITAMVGGATGGFLGTAVVGALGFALDLLQLFRKND